MYIKAGMMSMLWVAATTLCQAADLWREQHTGMEFVALPKGCFQMGLPAGAFGQDESNLYIKRIRSEMPQHEVCVDRFWLGRVEVRRSDWKKVMGDLPQGAAQGAADDAPVAGVTWEEANTFAQRLTELSNGKQRFRLPTEAEWEYACRAGAKAVAQTPHANELEPKAWFSTPMSVDRPGQRNQELQPGARKAANAFGLYDMLGNVWEWTQDAYQADAYTGHTLYNPVQGGQSELRVIRGGSIRTDRRFMRCEARAWLQAKEVHETVGLRLVQVSQGEK